MFHLPQTLMSDMFSAQLLLCESKIPVPSAYQVHVSSAKKDQNPPKFSNIYL